MMQSRPRLANAALTAMVICIGMFVLPSVAFAGVGVGITPTFPTSVTVGDQDLDGSLGVQNLSTSPESTGSLTVFDITLTPSCGIAAGADRDNDLLRTDFDCPAGFEDPGVFALSATGTGVTGTACAGREFNIAVARARSGQLSFTPADGMPVVLQAPNNTDNLDTCLIRVHV